MSSDLDRIDRYEIEGVLGRGAMGVVYRATDPVIGRVVALKKLCLPVDAREATAREGLSRFAREAKAAGLLSHPNIVTVYDVGSVAEDGSSYIAMEYVDGSTLRDIAPRGAALATEQVLAIAQQVARALDHAHRHGVVHRDVKPANILIREDGLVKLADFGMARIGFSDLTRSGHSVGSPSYIAPEVLLDEPVDGRADLFSLGIILYEILTGAKPFGGQSLDTLYHQILSAMPAPPSTLAERVTPEWDAVVMHLLAKSPEARYQSAAHLLEDLRCIELGRPLRFAPPCVAEAQGPAGQDESPGLPDPVPEEVIEASIGGGTEKDGWHPLPQQVKAVLALLTVAGFAIMVMMLAAVMRQTPLMTLPAAIVSGSGLTGAPTTDLTIRLDHTLRSGRIGVTLDGRPILTESIKGQRSGLRTRGRMTRTLQVPKGDHVLKVMVASEEGRTWSATTTRSLTEAEATLRVDLRGLFGRDLDLTWE